MVEANRNGRVASNSAVRLLRLKTASSDTKDNSALPAERTAVGVPREFHRESVLCQPSMRRRQNMSEMPVAWGRPACEGERDGGCGVPSRNPVRRPKTTVPAALT